MQPESLKEIINESSIPSSLILNPKNLQIFLDQSPTFDHYSADLNKHFSAVHQKLHYLTKTLQAVGSYWQHESLSFTYPQLNTFIFYLINEFASACDTICRKKYSRHHFDIIRLSANVFDQLSQFHDKYVFKKLAYPLNLKLLFNTLKSITKVPDDFSRDEKKSTQSTHNHLAVSFDLPRFNLKRIMSLIKKLYEYDLFAIDTVIAFLLAMHFIKTSASGQLLEKLDTNFIIDEIKNSSTDMVIAIICEFLFSLGNLAMGEKLFCQVKVEQINGLLRHVIVNIKSQPLSPLLILQAINGIKKLIEKIKLRDMDSLNLSYLHTLLKEFLKLNVNATNITEILQHIATIYNFVDTVNPIKLATLQNAHTLFFSDVQKKCQASSTNRKNLIIEISELLLSIAYIVRINYRLYTDILQTGFTQQIESSLNLLNQLVCEQEKFTPKLPFIIIKSLIHTLRASVLLGGVATNVSTKLFNTITKHSAIVLSSNSRIVLINQLMFYATTVNKTCSTPITKLFEQNRPLPPSPESRIGKIAEALQACGFKNIKSETNLDYFPHDLSAEIIINDNLIRVDIELDGSVHHDKIGRAKGFFRDVLSRWKGLHIIIRIPLGYNESAKNIAELALKKAQNYKSSSFTQESGVTLLTALAEASPKQIHLTAQPPKLSTTLKKESLSKAESELAATEFVSHTHKKGKKTAKKKTKTTKFKQTKKFIVSDYPTIKEKKVLPSRRSMTDITETKEDATEDGSLTLVICHSSLFRGPREEFRIPFHNINKLHRLANEGNADVATFLAELYFNGLKVAKDKSKALEFYRMGAKSNSYAQFRLAICYQEGDGVKKDYDQCVKYFELAATSGMVDAQVMMGRINDPIYTKILNSLPEDKKQAHLKRAAKWYQLAAEQGNMVAEDELANCYLHGHGVEKNFDDAARLYHLSAEKGYEMAQYKLALYYWLGDGINKDKQKAVALLTSSADKGCLPAQMMLGNLYINGEEVEKDKAKGMKLLKSAANKGYLKAQIYLVPLENKNRKNKLKKLVKASAIKEDCDQSQVFMAKICEMKKDYKNAAKYYELAAQQGHIDSQINLGILYKEGAMGVPQNLDKAEALFESATRAGSEQAHELWIELTHVYSDDSMLAKLVKISKYHAEINDPQGQYILALAYETGAGVDRNITEAVRLYQLAADQGHVDAQKNLGLLYCNGIITKDLTKATTLLQLAASQGSSVAKNKLQELSEKKQKILLQLKLLKQSGSPIHDTSASVVKETTETKKQLDTHEPTLDEKKDTSKTLSFYQAAAKKGDSEAQYKLGWCFLKGESVGKDAKKAFKYFKIAAKNNVRAEAMLGQCYMEGTGITADSKEAVKHYRNAAERGHLRAQYILATLYDEGVGVKKDPKEAFRWYQTAASRGDADAQFSLGALYEEGEAVKKDAAEAYKWYLLAAKADRVNAQVNLARLYETGNGVEQDLKRAFHWLLKAAGLGDAEAQFSVGDYYENGIAGPKNIEEAINYYTKAAQQKHQGAINALRKLKKLKTKALPQSTKDSNSAPVMTFNL